MARTNGPMMETLESRTLLSAATLATDEKLLAAALVQFREHQKNARAEIAAARALVLKDPPVHDPVLPSLTSKLQQDKHNRDNTFFADQHALHVAEHAARLLVWADLGHIKQDQSTHNATQLTTDSASLRTHRLALAQTIHDKSLIIEADLSTTAQTLKADRQAIIDEIDSFSNGLISTTNLSTYATAIQTAATKRFTDMKIIIEARLTVAKDKFG
ncbi:MAG TPA: hypothetical protein VHS31_02825 [Tepidisphaeraceae bacterium]|nr:hypothetical protein [Tepidisphaeraceae bacterium]